MPHSRGALEYYVCKEKNVDNQYAFLSSICFLSFQRKLYSTELHFKRLSLNTFKLIGSKFCCLVKSETSNLCELQFDKEGFTLFPQSFLPRIVKAWDCLVKNPSFHDPHTGRL